MLKKLWVVAVMAVASGCASTSKAPAAADASSHGVMCPTCETVWTSAVTDQGLKTQRLSTGRKMVCPECDETAQAYLKDGKQVLHNCATCKVTPVEVKPATTSHPKGTH